jgi:tight adherence protein C
MISLNANVPLVLAFLAFLVIFLLSVGIMIHVRQAAYKRQIIGKIQGDGDQWNGVGESVASLDPFGKSANAFVKFLSGLGLKTAAGKAGEDSQTRLKYLRAGLRGRNVSSVFWGIKFLLMIIFPAFFLVIKFVSFAAMDSTNALTIAVFLALLGFYLPEVWLRMRSAKRKKKMVNAFPDALDLMVVCVEAGMGLDAAMSRVGEELRLTHPELSDELKLLNLELRAGKFRQDALRSLAERTNIEDVNSLVTLLIQTDRFGTSVAQALRVFSDTFRTARMQRAEEIAAKIPTKLIFPLVLFIFPSFFVVMLGPAMIQIYNMFFKP